LGIEGLEGGGGGSRRSLLPVFIVEVGAVVEGEVS